MAAASLRGFSHAAWWKVLEGGMLPILEAAAGLILTKHVNWNRGPLAALGLHQRETGLR